MKGKIRITPIKLNRTFAIAMFIAGFKLNVLIIVFINELKGVINIEKKITEDMLKNRLKCANFLESFFAFNMP